MFLARRAGIHGTAFRHFASVGLAGFRLGIGKRRLKWISELAQSRRLNQPGSWIQRSFSRGASCALKTHRVLAELKRIEGLLKPD